MMERSIEINKKKNRFVFTDCGISYSLTPPLAVQASLPPYVKGMDFLLEKALEMGIISKNLNASFSDEWMPVTDFIMEFVRRDFNGKIFQIRPERMKVEGFIWFCKESEFLFSSDKLFVRLDKS
jgi:hypothetical protein